MKVVVGDDVFCDVFRIIVIASAAWVRAAPVVANNTPRRLLIPQEDILLFSLCVKKSLYYVSRLTTTTTTNQKSVSQVWLFSDSVHLLKARFLNFPLTPQKNTMTKRINEIKRALMEVTTRRRTHSA